MKIAKFFLVFFVLGVVGCSSFAANLTRDHKDAIRAIPGTETVIVGLPLNAERAPDKSLLKLKIVVYPGQKIVFAGPEKFDIFFKERKSLNKRINNLSSDGVVIIQVPRDLLDRPEYREELAKTESVKFNFGIRANGSEIDPQIIVIRRL